MEWKSVRVKKSIQYTDKKANKNGSLYTFKVVAYKTAKGRRYESKPSLEVKNYSLKEAALTYYQENLEIIRFHGAKTVKQTDMKFNIQ